MLDQLIRYVERQWITKATVVLSRMCVRDNPARTNNVLDWIEQGLTSTPTQYRLSRRQFYRSKDPTNSIEV